MGPNQGTGKRTATAQPECASASPRVIWSFWMPCNMQETVDAKLASIRDDTKKLMGGTSGDDPIYLSKFD